jgi:glucose-6-phosphate 1-dehydrogenase
MAERPEARRPDPHLFVIFGGTGDLCRRKLLPALYELSAGWGREARFAILGISRDVGLEDAAFQKWGAKALEAKGVPARKAQAWCRARLHHHGVPASTHEHYDWLKRRIAALDKKSKLGGNRVFYLALPASAFESTITLLGEAGLNRSAGWTRLVIEKPFGHDLASARSLNALVHRHFEEEQVFRIDHYLGKETVQNLLVFRFANLALEALWNRDRVASVQITAAETLGVEQRADYYDHTGALRDMVQNHMTQLLSLIGMEAPAAFNAGAVLAEKTKLLSAMVPIKPEDVVFGQYGEGRVAGRKVRGYRAEPGVARRSAIETYVAMRLHIDSWRWHGVPFYLRTGKRLKRPITQIAVRFKSPPVILFHSLGLREARSNMLLLTLQPNEGFELYLEVKEPTEPLRIASIPLHFRYNEAFGAIPDAYETLLYDVLLGDHTLFVHADETEASWAIYTPLLKRAHEIHRYAAGSWGPGAADRLLEAGERWHNAGPLP